MSQTDMTLLPEEQARGYVYSLLSTLLAAPADAPVLGILQRIEPDTGAQSSVMTEAWSRLQTAARESNVAQLRDEYRSLFNVSEGGKLLPYHSCYLEDSPMEKPLSALREDLASLGFVTKNKLTEPEDHVATLCKVMGLTITGNKIPFEEQKAFFEAHISPWMQSFFKDLTQAQSAGFYHEVGELGHCFIELEKKHFSMQT
jgi:TorA maturation chaperone TorD